MKIVEHRETHRSRIVRVRAAAGERFQISTLPFALPTVSATPETDVGSVRMVAQGEGWLEFTLEREGECTFAIYPAHDRFRGTGARRS